MTQHIYVDDRKVVARPYRTVEVKDGIDYNSSVWEVEEVVSQKKTTKKE